MEPFIEKVGVEVEMEARRIAYRIEGKGIDLYLQGEKYKGSRDVEFKYPDIKVRITLKGQKGQTYKVTTKINSISKKIEGKLSKNGENRVGKDYQLGDFKLPNKRTKESNDESENKEQLDQKD